MMGTYSALGPEIRAAVEKMKGQTMSELQHVVNLLDQANAQLHAERERAEAAKRRLQDVVECNADLTAKLAAVEQELLRERESHAWEYTPAMAEARINQLIQQLAEAQATVAAQQEEIGRLRGAAMGAIAALDAIYALAAKGGA